MNIVYHPMENPDGAANHYEFHKLRPTFILHGGYWSSVARDVGAYIWDDDPLLPEALVRRQLYYRWLPDVYMNPHGYPSHEWVHQFAGYKVPWFLAFWIPRGYHINLHHIDDPNYPDHKPVGAELRERIIEEVQSVADIRAANERLVHRFEKYARRYQPDPFRLEIYEGMNILFDHSYSFQEGGSFSDEIYVSSMWKRPDPNGRMFIERHPQITVLDLGCDMPDETAGPEWMDKIAARGQFRLPDVGGEAHVRERLGGPALRGGLHRRGAAVALPAPAGQGGAASPVRELGGRARQGRRPAAVRARSHGSANSRDDATGLERRPLGSSPGGPRHSGPETRGRLAANCAAACTFDPGCPSRYANIHAAGDHAANHPDDVRADDGQVTT